MFSRIVEAARRDFSEFATTITHDVESLATKALGGPIANTVPVTVPSHADAEAVANDSTTYTEPLGADEPAVAASELGAPFDFAAKSGEIAAILANEGHGTRSHYNALVPRVVPEQLFWMRYFARIARAAKRAEARRLLAELSRRPPPASAAAAAAPPDDEDDFSWGADPAPSPSLGGVLAEPPPPAMRAAAAAAAAEDEAGARAAVSMEWLGGLADLAILRAHALVGVVALLRSRGAGDAVVVSTPASDASGVGAAPASEDPEAAVVLAWGADDAG